MSNLLFANVELVRQSRKVSKAVCGRAAANLRPTGLQSATLPLRHASNYFQLGSAPQGGSPTEQTSDEEMERGLIEWRRMNVIV
jgi:hypothetical protein